MLFYFFYHILYVQSILFIDILEIGLFFLHAGLSCTRIFLQMQNVTILLSWQVTFSNLFNLWETSITFICLALSSLFSVVYDFRKGISYRNLWLQTMNQGKVLWVRSEQAQECSWIKLRWLENVLDFTLVLLFRFCLKL